MFLYCLRMRIVRCNIMCNFLLCASIDYYIQHFFVYFRKPFTVTEGTELMLILYSDVLTAVFRLSIPLATRRRFNFVALTLSNFLFSIVRYKSSQSVLYRKKECRKKEREKALALESSHAGYFTVRLGDLKPNCKVSLERFVDIYTDFVEFDKLNLFKMSDVRGFL